MDTDNKKTEIEALLTAYNNALNAADASKLLTLFSDDAVLMPNGAASVKGREKIKIAYDNLFSAFKLNVEYVTDEISVTGHYAYVRTNSKGNTLIRAKEEWFPIINKELFVLHKENDQWKISNYIFNSNK